MKPGKWDLYAAHSHFVLGFHGCDAKVGEEILCGIRKHVKISKNDYDWLGHGAYFWEASPQRALEFATERANGSNCSKGDIRDPFVIGAVINLKHCLKLVDRAALDEVKGAYDSYKVMMEEINSELPDNGKDRLQRKLDCAVIEMLHQYRVERQRPEYNSVLGLFSEGTPLYPGAGIQAKDHIQICVRHPEECILGYFRPIQK